MLVPAIGACIASAMLFTLPTSVSADDDDWEDRWEDYHEELEERREEARDRWEDRQERFEELREDGVIVPYGVPQRHYVPRRNCRVYQQPDVGYYEYHDGPAHNPYYLPPPNRYETYRYYGTPRIGYYDYGEGGAVRVGPIRVFWD
jgi:hypothetical protein